MGKRRRLRAKERLTSTARSELDTDSWPSFDLGALTDDRRELFLKRKRGILLYLEGASGDDIKEKTGLGRSHIYRLITERCLVVHEDGQLYGWRGVNPHQRIKPYIRTKEIEPDPWGRGTGGALQMLFSTPEGSELKTKFIKKILKKDIRRLENHRTPKKDLIVWFLEQAGALTPDAGSKWPFTVAKQGQVTIGAFIDKVLADHADKARAIEGGPEAVKKAKAGDGTKRPNLLLYRRVECDAHKLDARCVVLVPSHDGRLEPVLVHRLWVIVALEVRSRCVLGYHLSLRREPSADDVISAIKFSLEHWEPRALHFSDRAYDSGAGFPSAFSPELKGACWDEFSVDGALANVCQRVKHILKDVVGARLVSPQDPHSYSSRRSLDDRPFIEAYFRQISSRLKKLSMGTGSKPSERRGRNPEAEAVKTGFQLEYLRELLDVMVANYNATPHSSHGYRSPLSQMLFLASKPETFIRQADTASVRRLLCRRKLCRVVTHSTGLTGAHVNFFSAQYSAEWLRARLELAGKLVWVSQEDEDDARLVSVSTENGEDLGFLQALPPWNHSPHSLYVRSAIRSLSNRRLIHFSRHACPVELLIDCAENSPDRKLAAHPAYLEARRIVQGTAERLMGETMVEHARRGAFPAKQSSANEAFTDDARASIVDSGHGDAGELRNDVQVRLPERRKAANRSSS